MFCVYASMIITVFTLICRRHHYCHPSCLHTSYVVISQISAHISFNIYAFNARAQYTHTHKHAIYISGHITIGLSATDEGESVLIARRNSMQTLDNYLHTEFECIPNEAKNAR